METVENVISTFESDTAGWSLEKRIEWIERSLDYGWVDMDIEMVTVLDLAFNKLLDKYRKLI